jgi:hypothetical protein
MSTTPVNAAQEDVKLALAAEAARAERQNQPKGLLYGAGVLLLAALVYLGVSFLESGSAAFAMRKERANANLVIEQAGKLKSLHEASATEGPHLGQPVTQVRSRIEQAGVDVGLKSRVPIPTTRDGEKSPGGKQVKFDYEVRDEDLSKLLAWMERAVSQVPGLDVYSVSLKPEAHLWMLRVTFSRWERTEGA